MFLSTEKEHSREITQDAGLADVGDGLPVVPAGQDR